MNKIVNTFNPETGTPVRELCLATITQYHRRLLAGTDWQIAAHDIAAGDAEVYDRLAEASEPHRGCRCDACLKEFYPPEPTA